MNAPVSEAVEIAAALCRPFEGLRLKPYICPAGYPTIGYGTVYKPDGTKVTMDHQPISKETAEDLSKLGYVVRKLHRVEYIDRYILHYIG